MLSVVRSRSSQHTPLKHMTLPFAELRHALCTHLLSFSGSSVGRTLALLLMPIKGQVVIQSGQAGNMDVKYNE